MSRFAVIVCACLCLFRQPVEAQVKLSDEFLNMVRRAQNSGHATSLSGQFLVRGAPEETWRPVQFDPAVQTNYVRLNPGLLVVTCDRIKFALLRDLGTADQARGRVTIFLHQARNPDEPVVLLPPDDKNTYYLQMPDVIQRSRLVAAVVNVVLLEMANRTAADRSAEIPTWLVQGFTREIMRENPLDLIVQLGQEGEQGVRETRLIYVGTNEPPLKWAHQVLSQRPPLNLDELSWPAPGAEEDEVYRSSAQLFLFDLLSLDGGQRGLQTMLAELPHHFNWQTSFMQAFKPRFASRLDVEKWWALCAVAFTGRDLEHAWSREESWQELDALVHAGAQVRTADDELPLHTRVTLQNIIGEWAFNLQEASLKNKIQYLGTLHNSVSKDLVDLVDGYRETLSTYVKQREKAGLFRSPKGRRITAPDAVALQTIRQLDALDARREELRPKVEPAQEAATNVSR